MEKKEDRRVARTKKDLKNAFLSLLETTTDIKQISITDIVEKADYNRTTFYVHYSDKYDLLEDISQDTINGFLHAFREPYQTDQEIQLNKLPLTAIRIFNYIKENSNLFSTLFSNPIFVAFPKKFVKAIEQIFKDEITYIDDKILHIDKELHIRSTSYSILGLVQYWIDQDFQYSQEFMTEQMIKISKYELTMIKTIGK